jgi:hypothetical protein
MKYRVKFFYPHVQFLFRRHRYFCWYTDYSMISIFPAYTVVILVSFVESLYLLQSKILNLITVEFLKLNKFCDLFKSSFWDVQINHLNFFGNIFLCEEFLLDD